MKKPALTFIFIIALISGTGSQSIINTVGSNGAFKIKDGINTFFTLQQSNGYVELSKSLKLSISTDQNTGVIYKGTERFMHDYNASGTNGKNIFIGLSSGNFTMSGTGLNASYNTAVGYYSLNGLTSGSFNSAFGSLSLVNNTTGSNNSAFGYYSLNSNSTGVQNSAFGYHTLYNNNGTSNSAFGNSAMYNNSSGNYNSAFGNWALFNNTTGSNNCAFGNSTLYSNQTASFNSAFGYYCLYSNTLGTNNNAFGYNALYSNTSGNFNNSFGRDNLRSNTTGSYNVSYGHQTMYSNTIGNYNSAFGISALYSNIDGDYNTAMGYGTLSGNTTGNHNTAIGYNAGDAITTGSYNIIIGYGADVPSAISNNQVRIGNSGINYAGIQVAWTITSDRRWKSNIISSGLGLNFVNKLEPVSYTRNNDEKQKTEYGFIAQDVEQVLNECGVSNPGMLTVDDDGRYELRYNDLFAPIVKAIQELKAENDRLKAEVDELKSVSDRVTLLELTILKDAALREVKSAEK